MKSKEYVNYKNRKPIILNKDTVALIQIFSHNTEKEPFLADHWMFDIPDFFKHSMEVHKESAKEFINQLKEEHCGAFLKELALEALKQYLGEENTNSLINQDRLERKKTLIEKISKL